MLASIFHEEPKLTPIQMIQNDNDHSSAVFGASEFLAEALARYASIELHYRDSTSEDLRWLERVIVDVYLAILNYTVAVMDANNVNVASKVFYKH
jgi:hypothetical protein